MEIRNLIACPDCDLLLSRPLRTRKAEMHCPRCGASIASTDMAQLDRVVALALAAMITFFVAQAYPVVELEMGGVTSATTLTGTVCALWAQGMWPLAVLVACLTIVFPFLDLAAVLYVTAPMRLGVVPPAFAVVLRVLQFVRPWVMIEVLFLGVVVTATKLASRAYVIPETALFALCTLPFMLAVVMAFEPRALWHIRETLDGRERDNLPGSLTTLPAVPFSSAKDVGLVACRSCDGVAHREFTESGHGAQPAPRARAAAQQCSRCGARMHPRKPDSLMRTQALLVAAAILYLPANLLPVLHTVTILGSKDDSIISGVVHFWRSGDWPIATVIFIASVAFPLLKLVALAFLAWTSGGTSRCHPLVGTKLFRIIERLGRWSMLDIFVIALTIALVNFRSVASATSGWGAVAFAAVVLLTMTATMQFDPRLIWDTHAGPQDRDGNGTNGPAGS
ncbi:paraquat-inducible protein A [Paraburkholderia guartelaensis]|uniref:Paraquat-inducible protein A n=1 Tax=Paraburkholderia guartelaensis TaxID=2546446 RepID=A0A4R5L521_9BURK|nr:paraquat-inducible protein A [Paraburkholderia guartelaensis]TDG02689.1 paraquat-inducible protein A [Paraburkholderia guartelaensis]